GAIPAGSVTFVIDGSTPTGGSGITLDAAGKATFAISTLTVAGSPHSVVANYTPDTNFNGSSGTLTGGQAVTKSPTSTTLATTNANAAYGESTITATVAATGNGGGT